MPAPDFSNLRNCISDIRRTVLLGGPGPEDPLDYDRLLTRLDAARTSLPPLYRDTFHEPYVGTLRQIGAAGFAELLRRDPDLTGIGGLVIDMAHAILQNGEDFEKMATDAFQEVVSDLYDGFLSAEDRRGVNPPDHGTIPPLVKWGRPEFGPYTYTIAATSSLGAQAGIVNLPPANARAGVMAWAALGHETAGHDVLHADKGLHDALAVAVRQALIEGIQDQQSAVFLAKYWAEKIDETASDVLGVLNMGPAAAAGLLVYFRALRLAYTGEDSLGSEGPLGGAHPLDVLRGHLAAETVRLLEFSDAEVWAAALEELTAASSGDTVRIGNREFTTDLAKASAKIVAETLVNTPVAPLEHHALGSIQNWRDLDEQITDFLERSLLTVSELPEVLAGGVYAAHVVAAAVKASLRENAELDLIFQRMVTLLKDMHDTNPSWGPLFVQHPGDIHRVSAGSGTGTPAVPIFG